MSSVETPVVLHGWRNSYQGGAVWERASKTGRVLLGGKQMTHNLSGKKIRNQVVEMP